MGLEVATGHRDDLVVITLRGELDIYTVPAFRREIGEVDPTSERIVLDLNDVTLLDSSGLGAIVALRARAAEGFGGRGHRLRAPAGAAGIRGHGAPVGIPHR